MKELEQITGEYCDAVIDSTEAGLCLNFHFHSKEHYTALLLKWS